jgi:ElaA protein
MDINMQNIQWNCLSFNLLTTVELYQILDLRNRVFVIEQNCVYQDTDGKDLKSLHLIGSIDGKIIVYARLLPPGFSYHESSIGRVVSDPEYRGKGLGKLLMEKAISYNHVHFGSDGIRISAQCYLENFYRAFGFEPIGETYLEDGIPHVEMLRK